VGGSAYSLLSGAVYLAFQEYPKEGLSLGVGITLQAGLVLVAGILISIIQGLFMQGSTGAPKVAWLWLRVSAIGWIIGLSIWALLAYVVAIISGVSTEIERYLLLPLSGTSAGIITAMAMDKLIAAGPNGGEGVEAMRSPGIS
jgi:hypothetical protein